MTYVEQQFGVLCDRRHVGLGKALLVTALNPEAAWARASCGIGGEHAHVLVQRRVTYAEWSDPIAGETAGTPTTKRTPTVLLCSTDSRACTCRAPADTPSGMHHDNCPTNPASRKKTPDA